MSVTVADWIAHLRANGRAATTIRLWSATVERLCRHQGVDDPTLINRLAVTGFLGREWEPWTRLTYWCAINAWAGFVREFHDPDFDPLKGFERPDTPEPIARPLRDSDVLRVLSAPLQERTRTYILLALLQGLRVHEIAKLRGEDFDLEAGWMEVDGKGRIRKTIPLHPRIVELAATMPDEGWWFPSRNESGHVRAGNVSSVVRLAMKRAGVNASAHRLRDTFATRIQREVGDIRVTQTMLRHKNVKSTEKYTAVSNQDLQRAVGRLTWGDEAA